LNADHTCLHNSILNLVKMIPADEDSVEQIDNLVQECIEKVEAGCEQRT
jgi:hypothetical protein